MRCRGPKARESRLTTARSDTLAHPTAQNTACTAEIADQTSIVSAMNYQRAENGALDPWSLNLRFWGAPIFSPEDPKPLNSRVSERFGANIWGAPNADPTTTDPTPHSRPSEK